MYLYQLSSIHNPSSAQFGHLLVDLVSSMSKNICLFINVFQGSINKKWIIIRQFLLRIYNHIDFQFRNKTELSKSELSKVKLMREFFFWLWLFPGTSPSNYIGPHGFAGSNLVIHCIRSLNLYIPFCDKGIIPTKGIVFF